jgi:hypothetical protein
MIMKRMDRGLIAVLASALLIFGAIPAYAAVEYAVQPHATIVIPDVTVAQGATVTVPIMITEATNELSSADVNLLFDPTIVAVIDVGNSDFEYFDWYNPSPGLVKMVGYQGGESISAPAKFADVTLKGLGDVGQNVTLTLEATPIMGTGSPYGNFTVSGGIEITFPAVPAFNAVGMIALVGLLALVMVATIRRRR